MPRLHPPRPGDIRVLPPNVAHRRLLRRTRKLPGARRAGSREQHQRQRAPAPLIPIDRIDQPHRQILRGGRSGLVGEGEPYGDRRGGDLRSRARGAALLHGGSDFGIVLRRIERGGVARAGLCEVRVDPSPGASGGGRHHDCPGRLHRHEGYQNAHDIGSVGGDVKLVGGFYTRQVAREGDSGSGVGDLRVSGLIRRPITSRAQEARISPKSEGPR
mmetsp:Transcript_3754/g.9575  ORF Transcript_3754/g.9575 Transcript_3754/m.9575 type:complete len:216 (+) Transcript_3754:569-1216(+)